MFQLDGEIQGRVQLSFPHSKFGWDPGWSIPVQIFLFAVDDAAILVKERIDGVAI